MHKIIAALLVFAPLAAFAADDMTDCAPVGYQVNQNTVEKCMSTGNLSMEECTAKVETDTRLMRENYLVFKCPVNDARRTAQSADKNGGVGLLKHYVDASGAPLDKDAMLADTENVYIFRSASGFTGIFATGYQEEYIDHIMGPNPTDPEFIFAEYK